MLNFWSLLAIVLIVLKLTSVIAISWWWIVGIFFAPLAIWLFFMTIAGIIVIFSNRW